MEEQSQAADLSLETFGVRVSTSDIVKDIDEIFGLPANLRVRFELLCGATDCSSANQNRTRVWRSRSHGAIVSGYGPLSAGGPAPPP